MMNIAQPNDPNRSGSSEIAVDAISLTINGIRFFRCPTEQELSQALGSTSRLAESGLQVWDRAGVSLFKFGGHYVVEFTLDHAAQTQHGYEGEVPYDFRGSISIFNYMLPNMPIVSQIKTHLECVPKQLHFKRIVDFERFAVADLDPDQASPLAVEIYAGRFPPKPVFSMTITFVERPFERETFGLKADEGIIATHGLYGDQFWFALTNKRLIALKRIPDKKASPAGDWDLLQIRGFHILSRPIHWWHADYCRQRFTVELQHSNIQLRGFFSWFPSNAFKYGQSDADSSDRFFRSLRMAQSYLTQQPSNISCTSPRVSR
jgi:hypothetical protein